ncbi:MAG TPA: TraR/DksA C4-type zinc finger protein [Gemmatimonadaceae bacterium]|nr:TraR/DksA C4-type zinc finger protein [Gemmatimonadaceae bacterium]
MASPKKKSATSTRSKKAAPVKKAAVAPKPAAKPVAKPVAKQIAKPVAKPIAKPAVKPAVAVVTQVAKDGPAKPQHRGPVTAKGVPVKDKPWGKKELAHFEQRLMEERKRVLRQLAQWDESMRSTIQNADGDLSAYSFHMADQGTDAMEREKAFLFASKEGRYLWHIDEALRRMYKSPGLFGICEVTGERIEYDRLDALPHARLSYKAKREEEGNADIE